MLKRLTAKFERARELANTSAGEVGRERGREIERTGYEPFELERLTAKVERAQELTNTSAGEVQGHLAHKKHPPP